ncbi:exo-alpha-sialidase [Cryobacterium sp. HLT2-28]|nr:exo-alpha-sialidase [Cryobacterium sp. HLT2-28]
MNQNSGPRHPRVGATRKRVLVVLACAIAVAGVPATAAVAGTLGASPLVRASSIGSPFAGADADGPPCNGVPGSAQVGTNFPGTELEPSVAVNPANEDNLVGGWQQDRWSDGGSNATYYGYSTNGGDTWQPSRTQPAFSRCTGGTVANGGDYERSTDPWVSVSPDGSAYAFSLSFNQTLSGENALLVSKSTDGGATWGPNAVLKRDTDLNVFNDKNSITADPTSSRYVYAVWDRLEFPVERASRVAGEHAIGYHGPTWFSRTTDGGATWEAARKIFDPGTINQTIGSEIVVTGTGDLVNGFDLIYNFKNAKKVRGDNVAIQRSADRGSTWSTPTIVDKLNSVGVTDPTFGSPVRTGDIIPSWATDPRPGHQEVYAAWQDARSNGNARDQIAFAKSTDGGASWGTVSYAINTVHSSPAFTPRVHVLPDGSIGVLYYDFRNDDAGIPLVTSTWLLHSHDGGATWQETRVGADFDMSSGARARGYFAGDYEGLTHSKGDFLTFFTQMNGAGANPPGSISPRPASDIFASRVG